MTDKPCGCISNKNRDTYEELKKEYDCIKIDINRVNSMSISAETKKPVIEELENQINEVKEKMHDFIDTL